MDIRYSPFSQMLNDSLKPNKQNAELDNSKLCNQRKPTLFERFIALNTPKSNLVPISSKGLDYYC